jgi:hypothetical protein
LHGRYPETHLGPLDDTVIGAKSARLKVTTKTAACTIRHNLANLVLRLAISACFGLQPLRRKRTDRELWDAANSEERQVLAKLFLESAGKL